MLEGNNAETRLQTGRSHDLAGGEEHVHAVVVAEMMMMMMMKVVRIGPQKTKPIKNSLFPDPFLCYYHLGSHRSLCRAFLQIKISIVHEEPNSFPKPPSAGRICFQAAGV